MNQNEVQIEPKEKQITSTKNAIVVDLEGLKREFVIVNVYDDDSEEVYMYEMKPGETLIYKDVSTALSMYKPKFQSETWVETATAEEIEAMKPEPLPPAPPSEAELMIAEISVAMAELQLNSQEAIAELTTVLAAMQQQSK